MTKLLKPFLFGTLSIVLGLVFLYSAYTKLTPIQGFEYTIVQYAHIPWTAAAFIARLLIGIEAALGILILLNIYGRQKWVLKASLITITIFSIYLLYLWTIVGNKVNCGCFGDAIWMSPSSSLIKNIILICLILLLIRFGNGITNSLVNKIVPFVFVILTTLPFIFYGIPDDKPDWLKKDKFQLDLTALYTPGKADTIPTRNLRKGKYIIAFMSLSCPHCKMAARKMEIMKERNPSLPFYFVVAGKKKYWNSFWKETNAQNIPHTKLDADSFTELVGYTWPVIYFINNDTVEANATYIALNQKEIEHWLSN
jgi:uncharacterized membrane protein YphA (DoxX/SURF4 family)